LQDLNAQVAPFAVNADEKSTAHKETIYMAILAIAFRMASTKCSNNQMLEKTFGDFCAN
jgi:hypothetical protein